MTTKALRLWPGVVLASLMVLGLYVVPGVAPEAEIADIPLGMLGIFAGIAGAPAIALWWLLFSRAAWGERVVAIALIVGLVFALRPLVHESILTGNMGMLLPVTAGPLLCLALVAWAVLTRRVSNTAIRYGSLVAALMLASVPPLLIRTAGVHSTGAEYRWRWTPTPEERLLAEAKDHPLPPTPGPAAPAPQTPAPDTPAPTPAPRPPVAADAPNAPAAGSMAAAAPEPSVPAAPSSPAEWPGFRGPRRDGVVPDIRIDTNWSASPPVAIWRRPIGPGWSSFAVSGDRLYTQEQRGDDEIVACYRVTTGEPVWAHRDRARFWESNAGAGPRGTPTLDGGRVYAFGATGILRALDAADGRVLWSRDAGADTGVEVPEWGFASSPLIVGDLVVIATAGRLAAYDSGTGAPRWLGPEGGAGYSSPHLVTLDGVPQIVLLRGSRTISVSPADGTLLWQDVWQPGVGIVQPAVLSDHDLLISITDAMSGLGLRRLSVAKGPSGWTVEARWTTRGLKPYFNDFVVHEGHAYGFDGSILAAVALADGERKWKGGRYGNGQMVLLPDQDLLLVVSEDGELALVRADAGGYQELARVPAIEGKTWNHPVVVRDLVLLRNGEEMAAFRLPAAERVTTR